MVRQEKTGRRSLLFNNWVRHNIADDLIITDLDFLFSTKTTPFLLLEIKERDLNTEYLIPMGQYLALRNFSHQIGMPLDYVFCEFTGEHLKQAHVFTICPPEPPAPLKLKAINTKDVWYFIVPARLCVDMEPIELKYYIESFRPKLNLQTTPMVASMNLADIIDGG